MPDFLQHKTVKQVRLHNNLYTFCKSVRMSNMCETVTSSIKYAITIGICIDDCTLVTTIVVNELNYSFCFWKPFVTNHDLRNLINLLYVIANPLVYVLKFLNNNSSHILILHSNI